MPTLMGFQQVKEIGMDGETEYKLFFDNIRKYTSLSRLYISCPHTGVLPSDLSVLNTTLKELSLDQFNSMGRFPDNIIKLTRLRKLSIESTGIVMLPDDIVEMDNLKELILKRTQLILGEWGDYKYWDLQLLIFRDYQRVS